MELHLLIAEPRQAQRELLRTIYSASPLVSHIDEAATREELCDTLEHTSPDFVVVHQSLITDISLLPRGHFVILATNLDPDAARCMFLWHSWLWLFPGQPATGSNVAGRLESYWS